MFRSIHNFGLTGPRASGLAFADSATKMIPNEIMTTIFFIKIPSLFYRFNNWLILLKYKTIAIENFIL
jgi:hypothetical protein